jgi:hypothetical protein
MLAFSAERWNLETQHVKNISSTMKLKNRAEENNDHQRSVDYINYPS